MAAKLYSPVYSPGQTAKNPKKIYDKASNCRIALPPLRAHIPEGTNIYLYSRLFKLALHGPRGSVAGCVYRPPQAGIRYQTDRSGMAGYGLAI